MGDSILQIRKLGQTNIHVSAIGLGTVKFGRNQGVKYPHAFSLPTDNELKNLLAEAKSLGINLLDTAPAYGNSEERLGKLLAGSREQWIISTKVGEEFVEEKSFYDFSSGAIHQSVERSLRRLKTDYLDIVLVHSNGDDKKIIEQDGVFDTLLSLFGMSSKTIEGGLLTIQQADLAMISFHMGYVDERPVIELAKQKNKGILIKKAFASGHLQTLATVDPVKTALQFVLNEPGVASVVIGTINPIHLRENAMVVG